MLCESVTATPTKELHDRPVKVTVLPDTVTLSVREKSRPSPAVINAPSVADGLLPKTSVAMISPRRDAASKYVVSQLYQAYQAEAIQLPFQRGKETTYKVKFNGLADASRIAGDQVGKIYRQV